MYKLEKKTVREDRYKHDNKNPSFSSTLLDEIYRSIDDGDKKLYRETMQKKHNNNKSNNVVKSNKTKEGKEEEEVSSFRRACLIEKWMDKKVSEKANMQKKQSSHHHHNHHHRDHDHDQDVLFFSSTSSSSDSSSGGFSSSDTDSIYGSRSKSSRFVPSLPKPVRTSVVARPEKSKKTEKTEKELQMFDDYHYNSATSKHEESLIKSKSRALKIYSNLKKVKQPISPGGRLATFINSLFTTGTTKKSKNLASVASCDDLNTERKSSKSGQVSTCSSTSSFSRSCLSKNSPSTREKLRNGVKRTVRFYPVSVIVDEDCRPCGHKCIYEEEDNASLMSVSVPTAWKIGKSPSRKSEDEVKFHVTEKSRRVEEVAREFLRDYHSQNQKKKKSDLVMRDIRVNYDYDNNNDDDDDDDDDAASYSSSDLFELDHLAVMGSDRYCEELPVYETTHVVTNRAIANGFIM